MRTFLLPPIAWVSIQLVCLLPSHLTAKDAVQLQLTLNDNDEGTYGSQADISESVIGVSALGQ